MKRGGGSDYDFDTGFCSILICYLATASKVLSDIGIRLENLFLFIASVSIFDFRLPFLRQGQVPLVSVPT